MAEFDEIKKQMNAILDDIEDYGTMLLIWKTENPVADKPGTINVNFHSIAICDEDSMTYENLYTLGAYYAENCFTSDQAGVYQGFVNGFLEQVEKRMKTSFGNGEQHKTD